MRGAIFSVTVVGVWVVAGPGWCEEKPAVVEEREAVVVLPLEFEGVDAGVAAQVTEAVVLALSKIPRLKIISRAELDLMLSQQQKKQQIGCEEDATACLAEIQRLAVAERVVSGRVGKVADSYIVNLALTDTVASKVLTRASEVAYDPAALVDAAGRAALVLFGEGGEEGPRFKLADSSIKKVALLNLTPMGVDEKVALNLTQVIAVRLKQVEGLSVLTWDDIRAILGVDEMKQLTGCESDVSCMAEIGGAMNVDGIIAGHVGLLGDTYVVGLKLIDPGAVDVVARITESFRGDVNQLIRAARFAIGELLGLPLQGAGRVEIASEASSGAVIVADERYELEGFGAELDEGKYLLRIESDDHYPWSSDVYVEHGDTTRLQANLRERPLEWYEEWWVWTIAGAVVVGTGVTLGVVLGTGGDDYVDVDVSNPKPLRR